MITVSQGVSDFVKVSSSLLCWCGPDAGQANVTGVCTHPSGRESQLTCSTMLPSSLHFGGLAERQHWTFNTVFHVSQCATVTLYVMKQVSTRRAPDL